MRLTIAGNGYVGKAHAELFKLYDVTVYDPPQDMNDFGDPDAVLIAVATPEAPDGSCYMQHVFEVMDLIPENIPVLIKSTISIEGWLRLGATYPDHEITFSPEFLRQATYIEDVLNAKYVLLAGGNKDFWTDTFMNADNKLAVHLFDSAEELILAKYARNSFLATKVIFFNQLYDLCKELGVNYDEVRMATALDERIGGSHTYITEERGFGGHCFPKDTSAIVKTAEHFDVDLSIIREAIKYNNNL